MYVLHRYTRYACLISNVSSDYWGYFEPIRQYMPQNCSADVEAVIAYIDQTFTTGTAEEINSIKTLFNMNLSHLDDFAGACAYRHSLP